MLSLKKWIIQFNKRLLSLWVKPDRIEKDYTSWNLQSNSNVFYVIENHSFIDALVTDLFAKSNGFPAVFRNYTLGDKPGYSAFFSIRQRSSRLFPKKPRIAPRLSELVEYAAAHPEEDILLVPVTIIWGRGPTIKKSVTQAFLSDAWHVTGRFKKLITVMLNGRNTYIEFNSPISLREYVSTDDKRSRSIRKLARVFRVHFRRSKTRVVGPDLSHRRALLATILKAPSVQTAVSEHATEHKMSHDAAARQAFDYGTEIAANVSITTIRVLNGLLTRLWQKIYDGIVVRNFEPIRELAKSSEIIYTPCHRSHIDYLLLSYSLFHRGLNIPHIAAGINLNLPILGGILRRGGAFFMRRSMKDNPLYSAVFQEYIHQVFSHGHPVEYFVEGGRSRTGKMLLPKTGMLSMTVRSYLADNARPVVVVPVYIGYEKVFEDRTYLKELSGAKKEKENLWTLIKSIKNLKNFGEVSLNFAEPIHLAQFLAARDPDWASKDHSVNRPVWLFDAVNDLSIDVAQGINSAAALNPVNLIACVLLSSPKNAVGRATLLRQLHLMSALMVEMPFSNHFSMPTTAPEKWIEAVLKRDWLTVHEHNGDEPIYSLHDENAILMTYYRNNVMHLFALPALLCSLFNNNGKLRKKEAITIASRVYPYLCAELFLPDPKEGFEQLIGQWLDVLHDQNLLVKNNGGYYYADSLSTVARTKLSLMAQIILPTLERYFLTISLLSRYGSGNTTKENIELKSQNVAKRMGILHRLNAPEFFDKALFNRFIQTMESRGVIQVDGDNRLHFDNRIDAVIADADKALSQTVMMTISQLLDEYQHNNDR